MLRNSNEEWERRKWYLIRSLFEDKPLLSPIPEAQEALSDPPSPTEIFNRPSSPLPELIIEKERNRHDEPEEYYEMLERKAKKLYRKLFLGMDESFETYRAERELSEHSTEERGYETAISIEEAARADQFSGSQSSSQQNSLHSDVIQEPNDYSFRQFLTSIPHEGDMEKIYDKTKSSGCLSAESTSTSNTCNHEIFSTQAHVHRAGDEEIDVRTQRTALAALQTTPSEKQDQRKTTIVISPLSHAERYEQIGSRRTEDEQSAATESLEREYEFKSFSETIPPERRSTAEADSRSSVHEPEAMRRRDTRNESAGSLPASYDRRHSSLNFGIDQPELGSIRQLEEERRTWDVWDECVILNATLTPRNVVQEQGSEQDGFSEVLSDISSGGGGSSKRRKLESCAAQTSFSVSDGDERGGQEFLRHLFVGTPRVFRLCSCKDHVCC